MYTYLHDNDDAYICKERKEVWTSLLYGSTARVNRKDKILNHNRDITYLQTT